MPEIVNKPHVLISHDPGDARFARRLAEALRRVGFDVSLDEGGAALEAASPVGKPGAGHTLLIVTRAWLEGHGESAEDVGAGRRLAICRESIDRGRWPGLSAVEWLPDDPEPDARFWEVYCRLTRTPAGDPRDWSTSGHNLLAGWDISAARAAEPTGDGPDAIPCSSRPVLARPAGGWTLLLTDAGACFRIGGSGAVDLRPLPDLDGCSSVAVDAEGHLFAGLYDGMIATPRDEEWAYRAAEAPVLSLATTPRGLAIGDASGRVNVRDRSGEPVASAAPGEPVVELSAREDGLIALGAGGSLWRLRWGEGATLTSSSVAANEALGRPVGLFDTGDPSRTGVFGAVRVGVLGRSGGPSVGVRRFPEGINGVSPFGVEPGAAGDPPLGLLTDAGRLWFLEADLKRVAPVVIELEAGEVVGIAPGPAGGLLAWTAVGALIVVDRDRRTRILVAAEVALAWTDPGRPDEVVAVHWTPERGVWIRRLRPGYAR